MKRRTDPQPNALSRQSSSARRKSALRWFNYGSLLAATALASVSLKHDSASAAADWGDQGGFIPNADSIAVCWLIDSSGAGVVNLRSFMNQIQGAVESYERVSAIRFDWRDTGWQAVTDGGVNYSTTCAVTSGSLDGTEEIQLYIDEQPDSTTCSPIAGSLTDVTNATAVGLLRRIPGCSGTPDPTASSLTPDGVSWEPRNSPIWDGQNGTWLTYSEGAPLFRTCFSKAGLYWSRGRGERNADTSCWYDMNLQTTASSDIIRHEFGHALGLVHEMLRQDATGCYGAGGVPPDRYMTPYDQSSIMHYQSRAGCPGWNDLTPFDELAVSYMYPSETHGNVVAPGIATAGTTFVARSEWNFFPDLNGTNTITNTHWLGRVGGTVVFDVFGTRSVSATMPDGDLEISFSFDDIQGNPRTASHTVHLVSSEALTDRVNVIVTTAPLLL